MIVYPLGRVGQAREARGELLNKIRSKELANTPLARCVNPTNQEISNGTWKRPNTQRIFLQQFSKMFLSIAASFNCDEGILFCRKVFPFLPKAEDGGGGGGRMQWGQKYSLEAAIIHKKQKNN